MEQLPSERANRRYLMFGAWLVALLVLLNVFLLQIAREDRSWLVLGLMFLGPLLNLSVGGVSCLMFPLVRGTNPEYSASVHAGLAIALSILGGAVCFLSLTTIEVHGC